MYRLTHIMMKRSTYPFKQNSSRCVNDLRVSDIAVWLVTITYRSHDTCDKKIYQIFKLQK